MAWSASDLPVRPGVYTNFEDLAEQPLQGGIRGVVAIPLQNYDGEAEPGKVYTIERRSEAYDLFGVENSRSIELALGGGASLVRVYTMPEPEVPEDPEEPEPEVMEEPQTVVTNMLETLETEDFNVLVLDGQHDQETQMAAKEAVNEWKDADKHVFLVIGGSAEDDEDYTKGNTRSGLFEDDYVVNLINGVEINEEVYNSATYAPYIAGMIAGLRLNETLTYKTVPANDVNNRLRNSEIVESINAGSLVLVNDGRNVKVEKGITTTGEFIRSIATRHAILNDLPIILSTNVVAQIDNNEDGRETVVSMIKRYLETLVSDGAISGDQGEEPTAYVDPENPPQRDAAFFVVEYTDAYTLERVFLTVKRMG